MTLTTFSSNARSPAVQGSAEHRQPLLSVHGLKSSISGPFDLDIEPGACLVVSGRSGSGKSLFLRLLADLDPSEGSVLFRGVRRDEMSGPEWRKLVVYQAAEPGWWAENASDHFPGLDEAAKEKIATRLGIDTASLHLPISRLSTGERQRFALARSLSKSPSVLLLDEPTSALDEGTTLLVEDLLAEFRALGNAVILVTHSMQQAARIATRRMVIEDRKLRDL